MSDGSDILGRSGATVSLQSPDSMGYRRCDVGERGRGEADVVSRGFDQAIVEVSRTGNGMVSGVRLFNRLSQGIWPTPPCHCVQCFYLKPYPLHQLFSLLAPFLRVLREMLCPSQPCSSSWPCPPLIRPSKHGRDAVFDWVGLSHGCMIAWAWRPPYFPVGTNTQSAGIIGPRPSHAQEDRPRPCLGTSRGGPRQARGIRRAHEDRKPC